jgi:hypothetical protein
MCLARAGGLRGHAGAEAAARRRGSPTSRASRSAVMAPDWSRSCQLSRPASPTRRATTRRRGARRCGPIAPSARITIKWGRLFSENASRKGVICDLAVLRASSSTEAFWTTCLLSRTSFTTSRWSLSRMQRQVGRLASRHGGTARAGGCHDESPELVLLAVIGGVALYTPRSARSVEP